MTTEFQKAALTVAKSDYSGLLTGLDMSDKWAVQAALARAFHYGEYIGQARARKEAKPKQSAKVNHDINRIVRIKCGVHTLDAIALASGNQTMFAALGYINKWDAAHAVCDIEGDIKNGVANLIAKYRPVNSSDVTTALELKIGSDTR
jgi:hypothetical protein